MVGAVVAEEAAAGIVVGIVAGSVSMFDVTMVVMRLMQLMQLMRLM